MSLAEGAWSFSPACGGQFHRWCRHDIVDETCSDASAVTVNEPRLTVDVVGTRAYDLEWTDDYNRVDGSISANNLTHDFTLSSARVRLSQTSHDREGYITKNLVVAIVPFSP
jgi:hypothetical protein